MHVNRIFSLLSAMAFCLIVGGATLLSGSVLALDAQIIHEGQRPVLSGNGEWFAFPCNDRRALCITNVASVETQVLFTTENPTQSRIQHVDINHDGLKIVYWLRRQSNGSEEIWLYDRSTSTQQMVSVTPQDDPGSYCCATLTSLYSEPRISGNGRYVIFGSYAQDLVTDDDNDHSDIFLRDLQTQTTRLITWDSNGNGSDGDSGVWGDYMAISSDGKSIVFDSEAEDLDPNDLLDNEPPYEYIGYPDVFLYDADTEIIDRISEVPNSFEGGNGHHQSSAISSDGQVIAFTSTADNLNNSPGSRPDVLVRELPSEQLTRANPGYAGPYGIDWSVDSCQLALNSTGSVLYFCADWQSQLTSTPPPDINHSQETHVWSNQHVQMIRPMINGTETSITAPATNASGDTLVAQAELDTGNGVELTVVLIRNLDFTAPKILNFSIIPNTPLVQGLLAEITAVASDYNRGDSLITGAQYKVNSSAWQEMEAVDGSFDSSVEPIRAYLDSSILNEGTHTICARTVDSFGQLSEEECDQIEVQAGPQNNNFLLRCNHEPAWPQPGEKVTIKLAAKRLPVGAAGNPTPVERTEIWFNNNSTPIAFSDGVGQYQLSFESDALTGSKFTYGCRARQGDNAIFSGWRTVAIGIPEPDKAIPILFTGPSSHRVDIVLVADSDSYSGPADPLFVEKLDVLLLYLFEHELYARFQHLFNIWIAQTMGGADRWVEDGKIKSSITKPADWGENYAFADAGAIVHVDEMRDFAQGGMFTITGAGSSTFRHEAGHAPFGLADEYCCDGGYFEKAGNPNVYESLEACEADAPDLNHQAADCRSWESDRNGKTYYTSEPDNDDLMLDNGTANAADIRRFEWFFQQCLDGKC